jgi:hypothetical protein
MASAVTSGVVALAIEAHRRDEGTRKPLTPNLIKAILQYSAIPLTDDDPATASALEQGTGGLNAAGAIQLARAIDPAHTRGSWLEQGLPFASVFDGTLFAWARAHRLGRPHRLG